ncbi:MAG: hypothetical protein LBR64_06355 [Dysgonamonadaceae bacterium]|jgi:nitrite reductase/ring-hydroxylating ferredoxin subunit|nr:hypothetical protein [Dysgonamonadaceae bacterium]
MKLRIIITLFFVFIALSGCEKEFTSTIPSAQVYVDLDLNGRDNSLIPSGAYKTLTAPRLAEEKLGFGGILIVNGMFGDSDINIYAFDLACPYEAPNRISRLNCDGLKATCPVCNSVFIVSDGFGSPESGPAASAKLALKYYRVYNDSYLHYIVRN